MMRRVTRRIIQSVQEIIQGRLANISRENVKVIVGGAPVSQDWADQIGADGYGENAGAAVEIARKLMS